MESKIDLNESKRLSRVLAGKEAPKDRSREILARMQAKTGFKASADEIPGLETRSCLFFYNGKYYHVRGELKKLTAADIKNLLNDYPDTEIYFLCAKNICPMPAEISGKKMTSAKVKDDSGAALYMSNKSGVIIKKNEL